MLRRLLTSSFMLLLACSDAHEPPTDGGPATDAGARDAGFDAGTMAGTACSHATDCVIAARSCCGNCGAPADDDVIALHREDEPAYRDEVCDGMPCPGCFLPFPTNLYADCVESRCVVLDIYDPANGFNTCEDDAECALRTTECCECGATPSESSLVAIRADRRGEFSALVCEPETGCPECEANYAPFFTHCGADGPGLPARCRVDLVGP